VSDFPSLSGERLISALRKQGFVSKDPMTERQTADG